jgi:hypothetical protein
VLPGTRIFVPQSRIRSIVVAMAALIAGAEMASERDRPTAETQPDWLPSSFHAAVQTGDLVARRGHSLASRAVLLSDGRGTYSHAGVAIRRGDSVWIIHVAPATEVDRGVVVREPLGVYLGADRASAAGVYRSDALTIAMRDTLQAMLQDYARRRLPFDDDFDLGTPERLYCTELVWLAYRRAGIELLPNGAPARATPLGIRRYVFPSDLVEASSMRQVIVVERLSPT